MRKGLTIFSMLGALVALQAQLPAASLAADAEVPPRQEGEDRWVPSFAITAGANIQQQQGFANTVVFEDGSPDPVPLKGEVNGNDLGVSPFVGGTLELLTPALPVPTSPRLFVSGEILPTFVNERELAVQGQPDCVRGPLPGAPCARDITSPPALPFGEDAANGTGTSVSSKIDTMVYGARVGVAVPVRIFKRQLRIKPSAGWIHFEVEADAFVVDAACDPFSRCIDSSPSPPTVIPGFLRETILESTDNQTFDGIGPGLDVEMDVARYGPLGVSLFVGGGFYRVLGDRTINFGTSAAFDDQLGNDLAVGEFEVEVDPWIYRANLGIRFHWLGSGE